MAYVALFDSNRDLLNKRNLLVFIFTDGSPTSPKNSTIDPIGLFKHALKYRQPINRIFVTIIACTDDDYALQFLNYWDKKIKNLDVVDDYESEKKEIYAAGKNGLFLWRLYCKDTFGFIY